MEVRLDNGVRKHAQGGVRNQTRSTNTERIEFK